MTIQPNLLLNKLTKSKPLFLYFILSIVLMSCKDEDKYSSSSDMRTLNIRFSFPSATQPSGQLRIFFVGETTVQRIDSLSLQRLADGNIVQTFANIPHATTEVMAISNTAETSEIPEGDAREAVDRLFSRTRAGTASLYGTASLASSPSLTLFLSSDATANCYLVAPGTENFRIPVARANADGTTRIGQGDSLVASVAWATNPSVVTSAESYGRGADGFLNISTGRIEGNAVVTVSVNDGVKWSWHIWVTSYVPAGSSGNFMDRNLGALSADANAAGTSTFGLLYQWGRKDPFPSSFDDIAKEEAPAGPNLELSIAHPSTYYYNAKGSGDWYASGKNTRDDRLWNDGSGKKTAYDPCPAGWRIPTSSDWDLLTADTFLPEDGAVKGRRATRGGGWFPAAATRSYRNGVLSQSGLEGEYWNADTFGTDARILYFYSSFFLPGNTAQRASGFSVRCVKE
jgi:uncharacterized protein (TIGR02145 family)